MICDDVRDLLIDGLEGALAPGQESLVATHLASCGACREELESLKLAEEAVRSLPKLMAPEDFLDRLHERMAAAGAIQPGFDDPFADGADVAGAAPGSVSVAPLRPEAAPPPVHVHVPVPVPESVSVASPRPVAAPPGAAGGVVFARARCRAAGSLVSAAAATLLAVGVALYYEGLILRPRTSPAAPAVATRGEPESKSASDELVLGKGSFKKGFDADFRKGVDADGSGANAGQSEQVIVANADEQLAQGFLAQTNQTAWPDTPAAAAAQARAATEAEVEIASKQQEPLFVPASPGGVGIAGGDALDRAMAPDDYREVVLHCDDYGTAQVELDRVLLDNGAVCFELVPEPNAAPPGPVGEPLLVCALSPAQYGSVLKDLNDRGPALNFVVQENPAQTVPPETVDATVNTLATRWNSQQIEDEYALARSAREEAERLLADQRARDEASRRPLEEDVALKLKAIEAEQKRKAEVSRADEESRVAEESRLAREAGKRRLEREEQEDAARQLAERDGVEKAEEAARLLAELQLEEREKRRAHEEPPSSTFGTPPGPPAEAAPDGGTASTGPGVRAEGAEVAGRDVAPEGSPEAGRSGGGGSGAKAEKPDAPGEATAVTATGEAGTPATGGPEPSKNEEEVAAAAKGAEAAKGAPAESKARAVEGLRGAEDGRVKEGVTAGELARAESGVPAPTAPAEPLRPGPGPAPGAAPTPVPEPDPSDRVARVPAPRSAEPTSPTPTPPAPPPAPSPAPETAGATRAPSADPAPGSLAEGRDDKKALPPLAAPELPSQTPEPPPVELALGATVETPAGTPPADAELLGQGTKQGSSFEHGRADDSGRFEWRATANPVPAQGVPPFAFRPEEIFRFAQAPNLRVNLRGRLGEKESRLVEPDSVAPRRRAAFEEAGGEADERRVLCIFRLEASPVPDPAAELAPVMKARAVEEGAAPASTESHK